MRFYAIATLALLAMLTWARPAHAARALDNCTGYISSVPTVISTPGTWCLKQDVTTAITSGNAITIASDDVTLDCNDFRLDGLAGGAATGAFGVFSDSHANVRVRHCAVRGFYRGLFLQGLTSTRDVIEDNHLDQNVYVGMRIEGDNNIIRHNLVTDTGGSTTSANAYGILANGASDVLDNTVSGVVATPGLAGHATGISGGIVIARNHVGGLVSDGAQFAIGVSFWPQIRSSMRDNDVDSIGNQNGIGLSCDDGSSNGLIVRARNNVVGSFASNNDGCGDAGDNDFFP